MIRGILFDKDGTLIDFRSTWLAAYRGAAHELAERTGRPDLAHSLLERSGYDTRNDRFSADSPLLWATNRDIAVAWSNHEALAGLDGVVTLVERHFACAERYQPVAVGDLPPLFDRLAGRGLKLGVATMDVLAKAVATAEEIGISGHLDLVIGADSGAW